MSYEELDRVNVIERVIEKRLRQSEAKAGGSFMTDKSARVTAVSAHPTHAMSKPNQSAIRLVAGSGVEGDAHQGETVKHRSRVARDPTQPNLRQVHLIHEELFEKLAAQGFELRPGLMGENVTTRGIDLLALPVATLLHLGEEAVVEVTGLRNPCGQLNGIQPGLMAANREERSDGTVERTAGIMAIVVRGGALRAGDAIRTELPSEPHRALEPV